MVVVTKTDQEGGGVTERMEFGTMPDERIVEKVGISGGGLDVSILTLGAIIQDVRLDGVEHSLTLGSDDLRAYLGPMKYFGALVGPVANRIARASARIGGQKYTFDANENGVSTLHGGATGTHAQVWKVSDLGDAHVTLTLDLRDGMGGFPGNRSIATRYTISDAACLTMEIVATSDALTLINLANHSYWNLNGTPDNRDHLLQVAADHYLPTDERQIPTGEIASVAGTDFDFRSPRPLGAGQAYRVDHSFCLSDQQVPQRLVARLAGGKGVSMAVATTEPGLQVYDAANASAPGFVGHGGAQIGAYCGIAMEAQGWPDAPNRPEFPSVLLAPEDSYRQITSWTFTR